MRLQFIGEGLQSRCGSFDPHSFFVVLHAHILSGKLD